MTKLAPPFPGQVICYAYLWRSDHKAGKEEGTKNRPCAVILSHQIQNNDIVVTVAPITHTRPTQESAAIEIPAKIKQHLNLDDAPSWIICNEVNRFIWPGPDLRFIQGKKDQGFCYGVLPPKFFKLLTQTMLKSLIQIIRRTE